MPGIGRRQMLAMGAGLIVSGCSLPRGAANGKAILSSAAADETSDYAIYTVTRAFMDQVGHWPMTGSGPRGSWIAGGSGRSSGTIKPGDKLDLVVWDNAETSLLAAPGAKQVPLLQISVAGDGKIFVPYLDRVHVAGKTAEAARLEIQDKLTAIAPSAQVQLAMSPGRSNSVDLVAGVGNPGNYPLSDGSLTVLNLIALAGGASSGMNHPLVRLTRGSTTYLTSLDRLYENPDLDTVVQGGDQVIVLEDTRKFLALGAAGREQIVPFPTDRPTALEAIASIGGVNDSRADPKAILILREYPARALAAGTRGPTAQRVIFVIDMTTADGLFSAARFHINPDDVIYASESPLTAFNTISGLIGSVFGLARQVDSTAN
ncbi:MAG: polysaccharide biosynthesis/export family protein [Gemmobacter sp.]